LVKKEKEKKKCEIKKPGGVLGKKKKMRIRLGWGLQGWVGGWSG
jgi:hypothetical protein